MPDWSEGRALPDPRNFGILVAPFGPGVYELRNDDGEAFAGCPRNLTAIARSSPNASDNMRRNSLRAYEK